MSHYKQRFESHQIHQTLKTLADNIEKNPPDLPDTGPERETFERLKRVLEYTGATLQVVDPMLVTQQGLTSLNNHLSSLNTSYTNFRSTRNWQDLSTHSDNVLSQFHSLPRRDPAEAEREFSDALARFKDEADGALHQFGDSRAALEGEFKSARDEIAALESAIQQEDARFELQKGRLDQLITEEQTRFNQAELARTTEHTRQQQEQQKEFEALIEEKEAHADSVQKNLKAKADGQEAALKASAEEILKVLAGHRDRAKEIVGLIGNTGMTGHFQKVANREWWSAEILRGIAILFMGVMVWLVWLVVKDIKADSFNWEVALFRVAISLALIWPAYFCGSESRRHRQMENRNRRIELELASINPYLELLDEAKAKEVLERATATLAGKLGAARPPTTSFPVRPGSGR